MSEVVAFDRVMTARERDQRYRAKKKAERGPPIAKPLPIEGRTPAQKTAQAKYRKTEHGKIIVRRVRQRARDRRRFIGCDGEGAGTDQHGRQNYMVMRIGEAELYTGKPLTTVQCLDFICQAPSTKQGILVGFAFGYDVTMILRDLPGERSETAPDRPSRRELLFTDRDAGAGHSRYVWWGEFAIEYLPKNYLRVARTMRALRYRENGERYTTRVIIPGSSRTIYETFSFFQMSFLKSISAFGIGTQAERESIAVNKSERGMVAIGEEQRQYCAMEVDFLGQLMERFREVCLGVNMPRLDGLRPQFWNGAGKLASAAMAAHDTLQRTDFELLVPIGVRSMASRGYYGGRFEITRHGEVGAVTESDLNSAYPAMMLKLPCLDHGDWIEATGETLACQPAGALWIAPVAFHHTRKRGQRANLNGLPLRLKDGRICWPDKGQGTYWSVEIEAAKKLGCVAVPTGPGWLYETRCDCRPFDWVRDLYAYRKSLQCDDGTGKMVEDKIRGHPVKLAINAIYGKFAQRIGNPKFGNMVWAGLITALTRATLIEAAALDPEAIVMLATDAVVSLRPLALDYGEGLGQWGHKTYPRMFIVQPGLYWGGARSGERKVKTRGVGASFFAEKTGLFESEWYQYCNRARAAFNPWSEPPRPPVVEIPVRLFVGIKLAQSRNKPLTAGQWVDRPRKFDFAWANQRGIGKRHPLIPPDGWETDVSIWTRPAPGRADLISEPHKGDKDTDIDREKAELEEQPDDLDMTMPHEED